MTRIFLTILSISLTGFAALARGGDHTSNGAGFAEQNFAFAWLNLGSVLAICEAQSSLTAEVPAELGLLRKLRSHQAHEPATLKFARGPFSLVRTEARVGAELVINLDLLYPNDQPISVLEASEALILAAASHHSAQGPTAASLAHRCASFALRGYHVSDATAFGAPQLRAQSWSHAKTSSSLTLSDGTKELSLTANIRDSLICPHPVSQFEFAVSPVWAESFAWASQLTLQASLRYECEGQPLRADLVLVVTIEGDFKLSTTPAQIYLSNVRTETP